MMIMLLNFRLVDSRVDVVSILFSSVCIVIG